MRPIPWNFEIYRGATFRDTKVWKVGASVDTASPVDLTGCTARLHIRPTADSSIKLLELTTENGGIALGGVSGSIEVVITAAQTLALTMPPNHEAVYDMEVTFANGDVRYLFAGSVRTVQAVTRD